MRRFCLLLFAFVAWTAVSAAQDGSFAGQWKINSVISGYESNLVCTFELKGDDVGGTCKGGERELPVKGKVEGKKIVFQYNTLYEGQTLTIIYSGTLIENAKMTGGVDVQPMGVAGDFTGTQSK